MGLLRRCFGALWQFVRTRPWLALATVVVLFFLVTALVTFLQNDGAFRDDDPARGATIADDPEFGDAVKQIRFLDQGWSAKDTLWFDSVTQGSDLIPYDFFLVVEQASGKLFRDNRNMDHYRYLVRNPTRSNPDGLPVGIVKDEFRGKAFVGFTCAACHTNQVNYRGVGLRIDGGPAMADMDGFMAELAADLRRAQTDAAVRARFVKNVRALGNYGSDADVLNDLKTYSLRLATYYIVNRTSTPYGYARLDAFGRIYNQVLQYVLNPADVETAMNELINEGKISKADFDNSGFTAALKALENKPVLDGADRDKLLQCLASLVADGKPGSLKKVLYFRNKIFNSPDAPVSYPFVWDIPQHDYVQWNGIASNAGPGPIGRNTGEVIGVFGTMDWSRKNHWTLAGVLSGQGLLNTHPIDYASSVNIHNLALIEDRLKTLLSPVWPQDVLGKLDAGRRWRGEAVFAKYCAACHAEIDRSSPERRIVAHFSAQSDIGTDPQMAVNSVQYSGYSGILRNTYVGIGPGSVLVNRKAPVAALLTEAARGVVATPDAGKWWGRRFIEWLYDMIFALRSNDIQPSMKAGDYTPDTTQAPLASLVAYKGRSLNGIWATAPYLHNGSVPTLYDLLLPAAPAPGDPPGMKYRPSQFLVGSREFDPVKVGFVSEGFKGFVFRTASTANSNAGHEYGTRDEFARNPDGTITKNPDGSNKVMLPALTEQQRLDLVEYLKGL